MRRSVALCTLAAACVCLVGCARARRPDGPFREAQEFADAFSDQVVGCTREHTPPGTGQVVVAAEFTAAGEPPLIHDIGSLAGSDPVLECLRKHAAEKLHCPAKAPAKYVRIRAPVPLVTSEVSYAFLPELPRPNPDQP